MRLSEALVFVALLPLALSGNEVLPSWLEDPTGQQALQVQQALRAVWGGRAHPLANAISALNTSHPSAAIALPSRGCLQDVREMLQGKAAWALKMQDATVKVPIGVLALHTTHLGNWDECVNIGDDKTLGRSFRGKMCLVGVGLQAQTSAAVAEDIPKAHQREGAGLLSMLGMLNVKLGTCVPSSCTSRDVEILYSALVNRLPLGGIQLTASVSDTDCTTKEAPDLDITDGVAIGILALLGTLVVLSTAYDVLTPPLQKKALLAAFSVVTNGRKLLAAPRGGGDQTLSCLHGLRVLSMCWVVLGHRFASVLGVPITNMMYMMKYFTEWYRIGITNATLSVDTFFVLSGLLVGYLFFKQAPSKRRLNIPMYYIHRYIRLTPALALVILLTATIFFHVGWGPLSPSSSLPNGREDCRSDWWSILLYLGNYVGPQSNCVAQSWYLMVDMQLHWLSPLLLIPMARWPRAGVALLTCLIIAGLVCNFILSYIWEFPGNMLLITNGDLSTKYFKYFYIPTYTRFVPYLVGLAIGYIIAERRVRGKEVVRYDFLTASFAWLAVAALLLVPLVSGYDFLQLSYRPNGWTALYNSVSRPTWGLGVAGVVYLCANGHGGPVNTFLSWSGFQILGRFSYCVYLIHMSVQSARAASVKTPTYLSDGSILADFAGDLVISYLLAGILSLLCESPFLVLEKELLGGSRKRTPVSQPANGPAPGPAPGLAPTYPQGEPQSEPRGEPHSSQS